MNKGYEVWRGRINNMGDFENGGYTDSQLIEVGGFVFVCSISACWKDGKYVPKKDFTEEMNKALSKHHGETIKNRIEAIGG